MILNKEQKKFLKSLSHELRPVVMIGKDGINSHLINNLNQALTAHELVKVSMLNTSPLTVNEAAVQLASESKSEVVHKVGRVITLFKQSDDMIIELPR